jgi:microsomal dipeptidase-like Zn-dependent dipeptidase
VIADLHCHYPMKLLANEPAETYNHIRDTRRPRWVDKLRARVFRAVAPHWNYPEGWRVTFDGLEAARVRLVLSVLFMPFAEIDLDEPPMSDPEEGYFRDLETHLKDVIGDLALIDPHQQRHVRVRTIDDLRNAGDRMAFVHCVEGGFHLGRTEESVERNVEKLAGWGVGYVTLAHLFYRKVATNAPALPMIPDWLYRVIFWQPPWGRNAALAPLGEAAVRALCKHKILIDVSHMRRDAFDETFRILDELDPERELPVIASHAGYRFGGQRYMLDEEMVRKIAERDGVIGLIMAQHQLEDGLPDGEGLPHTIATVKEHVDRIHEITKSWENIGIGSDLDGFINPTMDGIQRAEDMADLERELRKAYPEHADAILYDNAARVIERAFELRAS